MSFIVARVVYNEGIILYCRLLSLDFRETRNTCICQILMRGNLTIEKKAVFQYLH